MLRLSQTLCVTALIRSYWPTLLRCLLTSWFTAVLLAATFTSWATSDASHVHKSTCRVV